MKPFCAAVARPRHLGTDESGREIFSYLPGTVPAELGDHDDHSWKMLRGSFDLITMRPRPSSRHLPPGSRHRGRLSQRSLTLQHGVQERLSGRFHRFRRGSAGIAGLRSRYAAWLWLDLGHPDRPVAEQVRRLRLFLAAYVQVRVKRRSLMPSSLDSLSSSHRACTGNTAMSRWAADCRDWTARHLSTADRLKRGICAWRSEASE